MARENLLIGNLVYLIFVLVLVIGLFFFVGRAGSQAPLFEQVYAKQIALLINKAQPGMEFQMDTFDLVDIARKNGYNSEIVFIDNVNNVVNVKLRNGKGYSYEFFSNNEVIWNVPERGLLTLKIVENQNVE